MDLQAIDYEVGGKSFTGYLADGSGGRRVPGILVAHEGPGLTAHPRERDIDAWKFPGFAYDADADRRSWQEMRAFFDEVLSDEH